jgi:hypothetical protein
MEVESEVLDNNHGAENDSYGVDSQHVCNLHNVMLALCLLDTQGTTNQETQTDQKIFHNVKILEICTLDYCN